MLARNATTSAYSCTSPTRPIGIDAALAYALVIVAAWLLPETKGRRLDVSVAGHGAAAANPAGRLRRASA